MCIEDKVTNELKTRIQKKTDWYLFKYYDLNYLLDVENSLFYQISDDAFLLLSEVQKGSSIMQLKNTIQEHSIQETYAAEIFSEFEKIVEASKSALDQRNDLFNDCKSQLDGREYSSNLKVRRIRFKFTSSVSINSFFDKLDLIFNLIKQTCSQKDYIKIEFTINTNLKIDSIKFTSFLNLLKEKCDRLYINLFFLVSENLYDSLEIIGNYPLLEERIKVQRQKVYQEGETKYTLTEDGIIPQLSFEGKPNFRDILSILKREKITRISLPILEINDYSDVNDIKRLIDDISGYYISQYSGHAKNRIEILNFTEALRELGGLCSKDRQSLSLNDLMIDDHLNISYCTLGNVNFSIEDCALDIPKARLSKILKGYTFCTQKCEKSWYRNLCLVLNEKFTICSNSDGSLDEIHQFLLKSLIHTHSQLYYNNSNYLVENVIDEKVIINTNQYKVSQIH